MWLLILLSVLSMTDIYFLTFLSFVAKLGHIERNTLIAIKHSLDIWFCTHAKWWLVNTRGRMEFEEIKKKWYFAKKDLENHLISVSLNMRNGFQTLKKSIICWFVPGYYFKPWTQPCMIRFYGNSRNLEHWWSLGSGQSFGSIRSTWTISN